MAIENVIYNTRAIIEMKTEMDYVTALSYLFKALEIDDSIGNMASRWTHLYNISTLYYFKRRLFVCFGICQNGVQKRHSACTKCTMTLRRKDST